MQDAVTVQARSHDPLLMEIVRRLLDAYHRPATILREGKLLYAA